MPLPVEAFLLVLCAALAAIGYGSGLNGFLRIEANLGDRGILGLLSLTFLACVLHFFSPITFAIQLAVLAGGVILAWVSPKEAGNGRFIWGAGAVIFLYVLSHRQASSNYDTGLYHLQTFQWVTAQHIVPGLGNLHGRFAFNSLLFPLAGVTDRSGIGWIPNLLVILFVLLSLYIRLRNITGSGRRYALEFWVLLLSMFLLFPENRFIPDWHGVLNADFFSAALAVYWICVAVGLSASRNLSTDVSMLVLSTTLAIVIKLSAAPLLLPAIALAWVYRQSSWRAALACGAVFAVWMLRGIVLSGCAIYPVSLTCIPALPWAESDHQIRSEALSIRAWGRQPGTTNYDETLSNSAWVGPWWSTARRDHSLILLLVLTPLGLLAALIRRRFGGIPPRTLAVIAIGLIGCMVFWFSSSPDIRFGRGFLLAAALLGGGLALAACFEQPKASAHIPAVLLAAMALMSVRGLWRQQDDYFFTAEQVPMYELRGASGKRFFVPKTGDQCWNHPLPCTPYFDPAALERIRFPASWPVPPEGWIPDEALGRVMKDINGK